MTLHVDYTLDLADLPLECIEDCAARGDVTEAVRHWIGELGFTVDAERARECLDGYGAWDDADLADEAANAERILWLACSDFREFMTYAERAGVDPFNRPDDFETPSGSDIFILE